MYDDAMRTLKWIGPFLVLLCLAHNVHADSQTLCPSKVLDSGTLTGVYKGSQCGDMCYGAFQLDSGESVFMIADPDQLDRELGKGGNRVSVNYDVQQFWNVYGEECSRMEVYKSGHVIEPHSKENASGQDSLLSAEYAQCMEKSGGVTVEMKDCLTAEDERIEALLNATYKKTMQAMDEKQKTLLRDSQRAWLKYREGSCDTMMSVLGGTSASLITTGWRLEMTARRVSWLRDILDTF